MAKPTDGEFYAPYQATYINQIQADTIPEVVSTYSPIAEAFYNSLPEEKGDYAYAADKWTIKDVLQHVIDTERIFAYRLLRIARGDKSPLPGFEQDDYYITAQASRRSMTSLKEEFTAVRKSTDLLLASLTDEDFERTGTTSGFAASANAIGYLVFGHLMHHKQILEERYL